MNDTIFDDNFDNDFTTKKRPDFLTVLLVLTSISVVFTVAGSILNFMNSANALDQMEEIMMSFEDLPTDNDASVKLINDYQLFFQASIDNLKAISLSNLILYLLEGFAVLMLYHLDKKGYWIYLSCQIGFVTSCFMFYPSDNYITSILLVYTIFTSLLFAIFYGVNYKYLK